MTTAETSCMPVRSVWVSTKKLTAAAQHMRDLSVGALPTRGDDDRLRGLITDRDVVIK